jgi:hypothetical protein
MSKILTRFGKNAVALPYVLDARLAQWESLRKEMVRGVPAEFTRDEWAYLVSFLDTHHLKQVFTSTFGPEGAASLESLWRPRGSIAIWLPNNVSLLGPLVLVLASFSGQPITVKTGSRSDELCGAFCRYCLTTLPPGELKTYFAENINIQGFGRNDPRNLEMAKQAAVRIAFGSDEGVSAVHALPHPAHSIGISFGNKRSEAWVSIDSLDDASVDMLLKVFAIYGQAGCTSPRRVVIIGGSQKDSLSLRDRIISRWPSAVKRPTAMNVASANTMDLQLNRAQGWDAVPGPQNAAVFGVGSLKRGEMNGLMSLPISWGLLEETTQHLPSNIQTLGYLGLNAEDLVPHVVSSGVKRLVPLGQMHHFGPVWDGFNFWSQLFEEIVIST